ncbi:MAG: helix-turn-helix domain-containing protein [Planctomycetota bacterium]|nr:helix-turn-helix domain-containing protein [Planctomycetota bacterium]
MATVDLQFNLLDALAPASMKRTNVKPKRKDRTRKFSLPVEQADHPVNRIAFVREQQEMTLRSVARHTGLDVRTLRKQEKPTANLTLTELANWSKALDVPAANLLEEPESTLENPVKKRAAMVRIMRSAMSIHDEADSEKMSALAQTLVSQLVDLMPELDGLAAWPQYGQRRGPDEVGRVAEQPLRVDL